MKASSLRDCTADELSQMCEDTRREVLEFRAKRGIGDSSDQPMKIRTLRRNLARVITVMREREIRDNG